MRKPFNIALVAATTLIMASTCRAQCPSRLPDPINHLLTTKPGWSILDIKDLVSDDQALWRQYHAGLCPGLASGHLTTQNQTSYAIALAKQDNAGHLIEQVMVLIPHGSESTQFTISKPYPVALASVVWTSPPGKVDSGGKAFFLKLDSFVNEQMEAWANLYYFKSGTLRHVVTSQ